MEIPDKEITFFTFGGNNYRQLVSDEANEYGGQAFITEYAAPANEISVVHPLLQHLRENYAYVTRLSTVISPDEMTVDPIFDYDPQRKDVSNVHDLSNLSGVWDCEREETQTFLPDIINPAANGGNPVQAVENVGTAVFIRLPLDGPALAEQNAA
jgi:hypothetical protein